MEHDKEKKIKKNKVLLVDDDPLIIRMYEYRLRHDGYEVLLAFDGEKAVIEAKAQLPDIILLDLMMPKMNGVETLKFLKKEPDTKNIPVIILTNLGDDPSYVNLTKEMGANDYLVKSEMSLKDLTQRVGSIIEKNDKK
ncbi:MAG: Two component transcriptional regulator, winged helix family [Parcubacteria group bacterium GW2011_GWF2_38_76]|nr:MAG: Two component transcriptional regulator, winged helix family [Parcubacteria group bacterium GW2011_GWF2_38_76]HBM45710.1 response regulator [Patescibacteria group bacterium]